MLEELKNGDVIESILPTAVANSTAPFLGIDGLIGHINSAEHPEDLAITPEAQRITPTQRSYVALRVRGFSSAAACRKLSVNQMAALRWSRSEWFDSVCEEEREKWFLSQGIDKKQEIMTPLMGLAVDALRSALSSEDERIRMAAVDKVFETFFDDKRPVGRPKSEKPEPEKVITLSDIQEKSKIKVNELRASHNGHIDIRANA